MSKQGNDHHKSEFYPVESTALAEPCIMYIKKQLESLLGLIELEKDGHVVEIDGFRLKNLAGWVSEEETTLWRNIGSLSTYCNCDCVFCFRKGNPPDAPGSSLALVVSKYQKSLEEASTRCEYYSPQTKRGLLTTFEDLGEISVHPQFIDILRLVRETSPDELLDFTTSGSGLTEDMVASLSELKPVYLEISLNSCNPETRRRVMKDRNPEIAIKSIPLLRKYGIPFGGSIVAWPSIPIEDIRQTILYLDAYEARTVKVNLPGYTKFFTNEKLFDTNEYWTYLVNNIKDIKREVRAPLTWEPYMFADDGIVPIITGVIKNSPADKVGLRYDDVILEINSQEVKFREVARKLMIKQSLDDIQRTLKIRRKSDVLEVTLIDNYSIEDDLYPYKPRGYTAIGQYFGLFLHQGFDVHALNKLREIIAQNGAKNVLFLSSKLMRCTLEKLLPLLSDYKSFQNVKITVDVAPNRFFGGNVIMGDLNVVEDYIDCIEEFLRKNERPDLIVIPETPFTYGRDLLGRTYLDIERRFNIPVELLHTTRILV